MRALARSNAFKKSYKHILKRGKDGKKLEKLIALLAEVEIMPNGSPALPQHYRNHRLTGQYKGFWECHIEPDWLLIYSITEDCLLLQDTGSHSDLF